MDWCIFACLDIKRLKTHYLISHLKFSIYLQINLKSHPVEYIVTYSTLENFSPLNNLSSYYTKKFPINSTFQTVGEFEKTL